MKMESETGKATRGHAKGIALVGLLFLLFVLGYYSGYRRVVDEAQKDAGGISKIVSSSANETPGAKPDQKLAEAVKTAKPKPGPKPAKRKPRSIEELPPAHLARFREVEAYVDRIPAIEKELLEKYPLLEESLQIQEELRKRWNGETLSEAEKERKRRFDEWAKENTENKWKADTRVKALKLDAYLEVLDDPKFAPFLEDGLQGEHLTGDLSDFFRYHLGTAAGLDFEGVESIAEGASDIAGFREAFRRFAEDVKALPGNSFAFEPLPGELDEAAWQKALDAQQVLVVEYYEQSILPEGLAREQGRHYQTLQGIEFYHFLKPAPKEAGELLDRFRGGRINFMKSIMPE